MCCMCFSVLNEPLNECRCTFIESYFAYFWPYLWIRTAQMDTLSYECFSLGNLVHYTDYTFADRFLWWFGGSFLGFFFPLQTFMHAHTVIVQWFAHKRGRSTQCDCKQIYVPQNMSHEHKHSHWVKVSLISHQVTLSITPLHHFLLHQHRCRAWSFSIRCLVP